MFSRLLPISVALSLAACGQPADSTRDSVPTADLSAPVALPEDAVLPASQRAILLADGIVYHASDESPVQKLSFGDSEQAVTGILVMITSESTEYFDPDSAGCSTTTLGENAGYFKAGKFVGFSTSAATLKTEKGIGIGSTRKAVTKAYDPQFELQSNGVTTFASRGLHGIMQGEGEDAKVIGMSIGEACEG